MDRLDLSMSWRDYQKLYYNCNYVTMVKTFTDDDTCRRILLEHEREREGKLRDIAASLTQPRVRRSKSRTSEPTRDVVDAVNVHQDKLVRNGKIWEMLSILRGGTIIIHC